MKIIAELGLSVLVGSLVLAVFLGCDDNGGGGHAYYEREMAETKARLDETKERVTAEQERTKAEMTRSRRQLQAEREQARRQLQAEREGARERARKLQRQADLADRKTEAAEADFSVAAVISLSAVLGTFLLLHLLLRELTARKVLARFLRHLTRRNRP